MYCILSGDAGISNAVQSIFLSLAFFALTSLPATVRTQPKRKI